jgi:hypothetical protein
MLARDRTRWAKIEAKKPSPMAFFPSVMAKKPQDMAFFPMRSD